MNDRRQNIGFVSYWFERGQAYVTKNVIQAIEDDFEVFVFTRSAGIVKADGEWSIPNLRIYDEYKIQPDLLRNWILSNELDLIFFNEEYDFQLVYLARDLGLKTVGIYYWELFNPRFVDACNAAYDAIICPTLCSYEKFKDMGVANIHHIKWGVDLDVFKPIDREPNEKVKFFHPAGWGGMHDRRGTDFVIHAFRQMENKNAELLIHTQRNAIFEPEPGITVLSGTVPREELISMYQESDVAVLPSKWEGLGLTFLEAIGCGLPIITVDAPPMNEFVYDGDTGFCCVMEHDKPYPDIFVPNVSPDIRDIAQKMDRLVDKDLLAALRQDTITTRMKWDWRENSQELRRIILELGESRGKMGVVKLDRITELIEAETSRAFSIAASIEIDTREYARFHKICADPMVRGDVLDVGCKHGTLAFMLAGNYLTTGVDKDAANIEICEEQREAKGFFFDVELPFHQAVVQSLPFDDGSFDTVILAQVIEHVRDPEDLKELMRVLRPDGCLIITTNVGYAHWDPDHQWFFLPDKTYEVLRGGWFFLESEGQPAFLKQGTVVPFGAFIEKYTGYMYGYQVYNNHESEYHSLEIYARVYKNDATLIPFPEMPGDEVIEEMLLSAELHLLAAK